VKHAVPKEFSQGICQLEARASKVASIKSADEQYFVNQLVFSWNASDKGVWTSGVLKPDGLGFQWDDGSTVLSDGAADGIFWDEGYPSQPLSRSKGCIQLTPSNGRWQDVSCSGTENYVLCQLFAPWVTLKKEVQEESIQLREEMDKLDEELRQETVDLRTEIDEIKLRLDVIEAAIP
jgi:hypothetical protein